MNEKATTDAVDWVANGSPVHPDADVELCDASMHVLDTYKEVCEMDICPRAMVYMQSLVDAGEWSSDGCEQCVIEFVCDDPLEHCMNPEDDPQWVEQCVRDRGFWQIWARIAYTEDNVLANEHHVAYYKAMMASVKQVMAKHKLELVIQ